MDLLMMSSAKCHTLVITAYAAARRQVSWYIPQSLQTSATYVVS